MVAIRLLSVVQKSSSRHGAHAHSERYLGAPEWRCRAPSRTSGLCLDFISISEIVPHPSRAKGNRCPWCRRLLACFRHVIAKLEFAAWI